jgi:hypothetical protein
MTFKNFIQSARVCPTPRGAFIADVKTWINAGVFPAVDSWAELYGYMSRRGSSAAAIDQARTVWRQYKSKVNAHKSAGEAA